MMSRADGGGRRRLSRAVELAACLLLATIVADLAGDTRCDALQPSPASGAVLSGPEPDAGGDQCVLFCVPDCFCCSFSTVAGPALLPPAPVPLMSLDAPAQERWSVGVRPILDQPPLSRT